MMIIDKEKSRLFFRLWMPLLDFVNTKQQIHPPLRVVLTPKGLPKPILRDISSRLWQQRALIDEYISFNKNQLSDQELAILAGWKNAVRDSFVVLRHLKSGSIFLPASQTDRAYIVRGITSTWDELLQGAPLPTIIETTLLPFCGNIISDGLVINRNVVLVRGAKKNAEEQYRKIKATGGVLKRLDT